jgi:dTMP kinase
MSEIITPRQGLFVVFEGGEGSDKSTQAEMLWHTLNRYGVSAFLTKEPGDSKLGKQLREILLSESQAPLSRKAELMLFLADRAEHVETVIKPRLDEGTVVICDRYEASTMAYQAHAGDLNETMVNQMSQWVSDGLHADVTYFLDVDPRVGLERTSGRKENNHYDEKDLKFHEIIHRSFLYQGAHNKTWEHVDGNENVDSIHRKIAGHFLGVYHGLRTPLKNF